MMPLLENYQKICPTCEKAFEAKRLNQAYCSTRCKSFLNNHKHRDATLEKRQAENIAGPTNAILWKNREILRSNVDSKMEVEEVQKLGFVLNFITRFEQNAKEQATFFCYDYGYTFTSKSSIQIFRK